MAPVDLLLLSVAAVFLVGVAGELIFARTNIPDVVWLIGMGVMFGPVLGWVPKEPMVAIAPYFGAVTLVVVLFNGGISLEVKSLLASAPRATLLALLSFLASVVGVASATVLFAYAGWLPSAWGLSDAIIVGAILGGSSSIVIMPAMQRSGLRPEVSNTVNLESALTDVLCVVVTAAAIEVASAGLGEGGAATVARAVGTNFGVGIGVGAVAGLIWLLLLPHFSGSEHEYPVTLAVLFILFVFVSHLGGSSALAILTTAVIIGNAPTIARLLGVEREVKLHESLHGLHARITFIVKSFFFTFIGIMLRPPWSLLAIGVVFGLILLLVRVPAVFAALAASNLQRAERLIVSVLLPRGMAAGVLAMLPAQAGVPHMESLPVVVFSAVVTTILIFAVGFPALKSKAAARPAGAPPEPSGEPPREEPALGAQAAPVTASEETLSE